MDPGLYLDDILAAITQIRAHEYFGVSLPVVWDVVQNKLGPLEEACRKLLEDDSHSAEEQK